MFEQELLADPKARRESGPGDAEAALEKPASKRPSSLSFVLTRCRPCGIGQRALFVAEVDRTLLEHELLTFGCSQVHAIRVHEAHRILEPLLPTILRDLLEDAA